MIPTAFLRSVRFLPCLLALGWVTGCAHRLPAPSEGGAFRYSQDSFGFANETVWNYVDGRVQRETRGNGHKKTAYTRRCFVVARAALQFWKFARFDPNTPPPSEAELARLIRRVAARDVWREPMSRQERIVISGFSCLREASARYPRLFQENIGQGWPCYFRPGNYCIVAPITRRHQSRTAEEIEQHLEKRQPYLLWLINFPSLDINHACLVYAKVKAHEYLAYDPNYTTGPKRLRFDPVRCRFIFDKTFYFRGGSVHVRPIFLSPLQ